MVDVGVMKEHWKGKATRWFDGTFLEPAVEGMTERYMTAVSSLRDKQNLAMDVCNSLDIPLGSRAGFIMFTNKIWHYQEKVDMGGNALVLASEAAIAYFVYLYGWDLDLKYCAALIVFQVFGIGEPPTPPV